MVICVNLELFESWFDIGNLVSDFIKVSLFDPYDWFLLWDVEDSIGGCEGRIPKPYKGESWFAIFTCGGGGGAVSVIGVGSCWVGIWGGGNCEECLYGGINEPGWWRCGTNEPDWTFGGCNGGGGGGGGSAWNMTGIGGNVGGVADIGVAVCEFEFDCDCDCGGGGNGNWVWIWCRGCWSFGEYWEIVGGKRVELDADWCLNCGCWLYDCAWICGGGGGGRTGGNW